MTEHVLLELKHKNGTVAKIYQDENSESPRSWDNLGTLKTWIRNYDFSDKNAPNLNSSDDFEDWSKENDVALFMRIDFCDYGSGGLRISMDDGDYHSDGVIFVTNERLFKEFAQKTLTGEVGPETLKKAKDVLKAELRTLNQWANGEVYGYTIEKSVTCKTCKHTENENVDSCWGFYGMETIKEELQSQGFK